MFSKKIKIAVAKNNNFIEPIAVSNIQLGYKINGKILKCTKKNVFMGNYVIEWSGSFDL